MVAIPHLQTVALCDYSHAPSEVERLTGETRRITCEAAAPDLRAFDRRGKRLDRAETRRQRYAASHAGDWHTGVVRARRVTPHSALILAIPARSPASQI